MDILIYREPPRESQRKCSLTPLRDRPNLRFVHYKRGRRLGPRATASCCTPRETSYRHPTGAPISC